MLKYSLIVSLFITINCSSQIECEVGVIMHKYYPGDSIYIGEFLKSREFGIGFYFGSQDSSDLILNIDRNRDVKSTIVRSANYYEFDCSILFFDNVVPFLSEKNTFKIMVNTSHSGLDSAIVSSHLASVLGSVKGGDLDYIDSFSFRDFYGDSLMAFTYKHANDIDREYRTVTIITKSGRISRIMVVYPSIEKLIIFYSLEDLAKFYDQIDEKGRYKSKNYPRLFYYWDDVKCLPTAIGLNIDVLSVIKSERRK